MKKIIKTHIYAGLLNAVLVAACGVGVSDVLAQAYPNKTIRMVVPIGAGGGTDSMGRMIAQKLSEQMGVNIIVDNRPGAGTVIGTEYFSKTAPDGYTLMTVAPEFSINPSLRKLPYDPIKDFIMVTQLTSGHSLLAEVPDGVLAALREALA
jgi:tripartite-type tricarboxylate transporter receptor subunit TctC